MAQLVIQDLHLIFYLFFFLSVKIYHSSIIKKICNFYITSTGKVTKNCKNWESRKNYRKSDNDFFAFLFLCPMIVSLLFAEELDDIFIRNATARYFHLRSRRSFKIVAFHIRLSNSSGQQRTIRVIWNHATLLE